MGILRTIHKIYLKHLAINNMNVCYKWKTAICIWIARHYQLSKWNDMFNCNIIKNNILKLKRINKKITSKCQNRLKSIYNDNNQVTRINYVLLWILSYKNISMIKRTSLLIRLIECFIYLIWVSHVFVLAHDIRFFIF